MNLLKLGPALERFAEATSGPAIQVEGDACVHQWNRASDCRLCIEVCPVQAITWGAEAQITLEQERCTLCGFCLHGCPTGVFTGGIDETARLLQTVGGLEARAAIDLTCRHRPATEAEAPNGAIVETGGCLAALGTATYVGLAALGVERAHLRLEGCGECPIGSLRTQIERTAAAAAMLTTLAITVVVQPPGQTVRRPVHATRAPLLSRRSLWQRMRGHPSARSSALPPPPPPAEGHKQPPHERRALLHYLAHLPAAQQAPAPYFRTLTAEPSCTACGVCAGVCPTGALAFGDDGTAFTLEFAPLACTDCGLCTQLCPPRALLPGSPVAYGDAFPALLLAGERKECRRCRTLFAGDGDFCPVCAFRRLNPAASMTRSPAATA